MNRLEQLIIGLCSWIFLLTQMTRISQELTIAPPMLLLVLLTAVFILVAPDTQPMRIISALFALLGYVTIQITNVEPFQTSSLLKTLLDSSIITITLLLIWQIKELIATQRHTVSKLMFDKSDAKVKSFEKGQRHIYREIRRARRHERPVALMTLQPEGQLDIQLKDILDEMADDLAARYTANQISKWLLKELLDSNVIVKQNDHYIVLLPEMNEQRAEQLSKQLTAKAREQLGITFDIGFSTFPDDSITFESLLKTAVSRMKKASQAQSAPPMHDIKHAPKAAQKV